MATDRLRSRPQAAERLAAKGARAATDARTAVAGPDVVFTCLPTTELVDEFWGLHASELSPGAIAVDLSSIDPATSRRVACRVEKAGNAFVTCTLGKTPAMAEQGNIPVFVGGESNTVAALAPLLQHMARDAFDMGSVEGATMFKLISNLVGMSNLAILAEGHLLAKQAGIDDATFAAALQTTGGWSVQPIYG